MPVIGALRKLGRYLGIALAAAVLSAFVYEHVGAWRDGRVLTRVGHSIDIGGRSLNLDCVGEGRGGTRSRRLDRFAASPGRAISARAPDCRRRERSWDSGRGAWRRGRGGARDRRRHSCRAMTGFDNI